MIKKITILMLFLVTAIGILSLQQFKNSTPKKVQTKKDLYKEIDVDTYDLNTQEGKFDTTKEKIRDTVEVMKTQKTVGIQQTSCYGQTGASACSGNGQCTGTNQCTCNNGFQGLQCQTACPAAQFVSTQFSSSGSQILVEFTVNILASSRAHCDGKTTGFNTLFNNATAYGVGATCTFSTLKNMIVFLGTTPLIKPTDLLSFSAGKLSAVMSCGTSLSSPISVAGPTNVVPVKASISGANQIANCAQTSLVLNAGSSAGAGELSYEWSLSTDPKYVVDNAIKTTLGNLKRTDSKVAFSNNLIPFGVLGFQLKVIDYFGATSTVIFPVEKLISDTPVVTINPLKGGKAPVGQATQISATTSFSPCTTETDSKALEYSWTCTSHSGLVFTGSKTSVISISPYVLTAATSYTFELYTSLIQKGFSGLSLGNSTASYTIVGQEGNLQSALAGQTSVNLLTTDTLSLDASTSKDLNVQNGANPAATFSWSCCELNTETGACDKTSCQNKFTDLAANTQKQYSKDGSLPAGDFIFTVTMSHLSRTKSSTSKTVTILQPAAPRIQLTSEKKSCARATVSVTTENIGGTITFTTAVEEGQVTVLSLVPQGTKAILLLDTSAITSKTVLKVTATSGSIAVSERVIVIPPPQPFGGSISITDLNDVEVTGSLAGQTKYKFSTSGYKTTTGASVASSALLQFIDAASSKVINSYSFTLNAETREFETPVSAKALSGKIVMNLFTSEDCSSIENKKDFTVAAFQLSGGQTYDDIAASQANSTLASAISSGSSDEVANAASSILATLEQSTGSGNSEKRAAIKLQVVSAFTSSLSSTAVVTKEAQASGASLISSALSVSSEISPALKTQCLDAFANLFKAPAAGEAVKGIAADVADKALGSLGALLGSPSSSSSLLSLDDTEQSGSADFKRIQGLVRGILRETLALKGFNDRYSTISSAGLAVSGIKYSSSSIPTTAIDAFADSSFTIQSANYPITNAPSIIDFYFVKYQPSAFSFTSTANVTTSINSAEIVNDNDGTNLVVSGPASAIILRMSTSYAQIGNDRNECRYYNVTTNTFEDVTTDIGVASGVVTCSTSHLTDFAAFRNNEVLATPAPTAAPTTGPTTEPTAEPTQAPVDLTPLYIVLAVLGVILIVGLVVGGVVVIGIIIYRSQQKDKGGLRRLNFFNNDDHEVI